jgi:pimeloyl-[acyl-carrier protein] synthase
MSAAIDLNVFDPAFRTDPYPFFQQLRETDPLHWNPPGFWLVTNYADAMALLRDPRIGHPKRRTAEYTEYLYKQGQLSPVELMLSHMLLSKNPPDHTRLRGLMNKAFTPAVVESLRPQIQALVDTLLDQVQGQTAFDLMTEVAYPLPIMVIAELLGVPMTDRQQFKQWSHDLLGVFDITPNAEAINRGNAAIQKFIEYFQNLVTTRRSAPKDDLLSALIAVNEQGEKLNDYELLTNCILLLVAGHETTMNLIGNGILALLRHPDQFTKLRDDSTLIDRAVEELLRYESPVQFFGRRANEDVTINGKTLLTGQGVFILPGAINRDPAQFADPDVLDITRTENRHLAFGYGIHFCLGAPLARVEGQIAINTIVQRMPTLQLCPDPVEWREVVAVRGLKSLRVASGNLCAE